MGLGTDVTLNTVLPNKSLKLLLSEDDNNKCLFFPLRRLRSPLKVTVFASSSLVFFNLLFPLAPPPPHAGD